MDTTHQDDGILEAYGLAYRLLRAGVPVDWTIAAGKPFAGVDFTATATDLATSAVIDGHGYRGGPFVVASEDSAVALPVVLDWQAAHPTVVVHRAIDPFEAAVARHLAVAPDVAVFVDGHEEIAFGYLNAAGIPMSNGLPWPDKQDNNGRYSCPGEFCCPDCLDEAATAGPTTGDHADGGLFDGAGVPRYCQFVSMHYKEPAGTPEVVAEVRAFLEFPVHFLAECEAVTAFENAVGGRFLTGGGLVAGTATGDVDHYHSDDPFVQGDGGYATGGGNVSAFSLATGSHYYTSNVVMLSRRDSGTGSDDIWMNGHLDADPRKGKVSYLGGHKYGTHTPASTHADTLGTRFFLNSLFEAPCAGETGQPAVSTRVGGESGTNVATHSLEVCYDNVGPGIAFDAVLELTLPAGVGLSSVTGAGVHDGGAVRWQLGSLAAGADVCFSATVELPGTGRYEFSSTLSYRVGVVEKSVDSGPPFSVHYSPINLLRYGGIHRIDPVTPALGWVFAARDGLEPALDPNRDLEAVAFASGAPFTHDVDDLSPASPPLVLYELDGYDGDTLRVTRWGGKLIVTY